MTRRWRPGEPEAVARSLRGLWQAVEQLAGRLAEVERRTAALEHEMALGRETRRVPAVAAARRLGLSLASVRRLVESGALAGEALHLPDRERRVWVVELESLQRFEGAGGAVGAPGAGNRLLTGRARRGEGG